jgi:elongation factor Ts
MADMELIKKLREVTGAGVLDCKNALAEANDDVKAAAEILMKKAKAIVAKKSTRNAAEGRIGTYVHPGDKIAVMCEVNTETDFAAKNDEYLEFVRNVCMHIAALAPVYVSADDIPAEAVAKQKEIFLAQLGEDPKMAGKPQQVLDKIIEGKIKKWHSDVCLMDQAYVKDQEKTVRDYLDAVVGKIRENIKVRRFARYSVGEESF